MKPFVSFDSFPIVYWGIASFLAVCLGGILLLKKGERFRNIYVLLGVILLFVMRLPVIFFNRELNEDESQMLAQGMTLFKDLVYWKAVDGTTGGPLSSYFLFIPALFTSDFSYTTAHLGAVLLVVVSLFFLYKSLENWFGWKTASISIFPVFMFYSFTQYGDFVHFSSEHVPVAIIAVILWLLSSPSLCFSTLGTLSIGVLLAALPFGKIQALPLGFSLFAYAVWQSINHKNFRSVLLYAVGGLGFFAIVGIVLQLLGVFDDFFTFYIQANLAYGSNESWLSSLLTTWNSFSRASDFYLVVFSLLLSFVLILFTNSWRSMNRKLALFSVFYILMALVATSRTGSGYTHYLLFWVSPFALLTAVFLAPVVSRFSFVGALVVVTTLLFLFLGIYFNYVRNGVLNQYSSGGQIGNRIFPISKTGTKILEYGKEGDYLVVWGWRCQYYVETQMLQGVAENHSIRSIFEHPLRDIYRNRYISDIKRTQPAVFIDAVGKNSLWVQNTKTQGYESFPELAAHISGNYKLVTTVDGNRMFVRNDRLKN